MKDVLANLMKLPAQSAALIDGTVALIRRGGGYQTFPSLARDQIDQWNRKHGVTPQQAQAMLIGVTLGWEMDGADPDTHAEPLGRGDEVGPFSYSYDGTIQLVIQVEAMSEEDAATVATGKIEQLTSMLDHLEFPEGMTVSIDRTFDLIETDDPR